MISLVLKWQIGYLALKKIELLSIVFDE